MAYLHKYLTLHKTPRWNEGSGIWHVSPTVPKNGPTPMSRWLPSVNALCEPLMGVPIYQYDLAANQLKIVGVKYLKTRRRHLLYREALELVKVAQKRDELFTLALYRRQVTREGGIPLDTLFLDLAETFNLTPSEWLILAERMPRRSEVRRICFERS